MLPDSCELSLEGLECFDAPTLARSGLYVNVIYRRALTIEEVGVNGTTDLLQVRIRRADVVRVWRDPAEPWQWRERPTRIHRWPAGTFVVVIGTAAPSGVIDGTRVELPKVAPE